MRISTSSAPHHPDTGPAATPGPNCEDAWKRTTPPAPHPQTPPTTPATPAPPTPPAAAPSDAGTPNAAGSTGRPRLPALEEPGERLDEQEDVQADDHGSDGNRSDG